MPVLHTTTEKMVFNQNEQTLYVSLATAVKAGVSPDTLDSITVVNVPMVKGTTFSRAAYRKESHNYTGYRYYSRETDTWLCIVKYNV